MSDSVDACDPCLSRAWLLRRLAGHLDRVRHRVPALLELGGLELIAATGGARAPELRREWSTIDLGPLRSEIAAAGAVCICRHDGRYPQALTDLAAPPPVLFLRGNTALLPAAEPVGVAIVGSRRASTYGSETARALSGRLAAAGIPVLSGMALGIDGAAHEGALAAHGTTIAVLPAGPERAYPGAHRTLYGRILARGLVITELPPGSQVRRWGFLARNRLIAGLARATVVVEAGARSGALVTARLARELGRPVGAVPGRVTAPGSAGPHRLIAEGAQLIEDAQSVVELAFGTGPTATRLLPDRRPALTGELSALLGEIASGRDTPGALEAAGMGPERGLAALAALELAGYILREAGGRYSVSP